METNGCIAAACYKRTGYSSYRCVLFFIDCVQAISHDFIPTPLVYFSQILRLNSATVQLCRILHGVRQAQSIS